MDGDEQLGRPLSEYRERDFGGAERWLRREEAFRRFGAVVGVILAVLVSVGVILAPWLAPPVMRFFGP
jgi:hypothetical protein